MTQPTQEELKEFWEWCGFKHEVPEIAQIAKKEAEVIGQKNIERFDIEQWYIPGKYCGAMPPLTLDNLFRWARPDSSVEFTYDQCTSFARIYKNFEKCTGYSSLKSDNPEAVALFQAIQQARGLVK